MEECEENATVNSHGDSMDFTELEPDLSLTDNLSVTMPQKLWERSVTLTFDYPRMLHRVQIIPTVIQLLQSAGTHTPVDWNGVNRHL